MERVGDRLLEAGVPPWPEPDGLTLYLRLALFSWIVGNGDLHAKNVSVLRRFRRGRPGEPPVLERVDHAPLYDLVNTRLHIPGDAFALPVDGRQNNIRLKSFQRLARRWEIPAESVQAEALDLVRAVRAELPAVLDASGLPADHAARYAAIVEENIEGLVRGDA
jgi:serine/threonine-protein kinase HipA